MPQFPPAADLKTGDLLFPRKLEPSSGNTLVGGGGTSFLAGLIESVKKPLHASLFGTSGSVKMADLLKTQLRKEATGPSLIEQWIKPASAIGWAYQKENFGSAPKSIAGTGGLPIGVLLDLYKIMSRSEFKILFRDWLNMTVDEFTRHPLMTILRAGLANDVEAGFFVGHVGMVLREKDGKHSDDVDANVYIIEANASDFAHYRVAVHPYRRATQPDPKTSPQEGWTNYHVDYLGRSVWHRRPRVLETPPEDFGAAILRQALVNESKKYHGRPYGFFEAPELGYIDRFYCSEFVNKVWEDALGTIAVTVPTPCTAVASTNQFLLKDRMCWKWLYDNRKAMSNDKAFQDQLELAFNAEFTADDGTTGHSFMKDYIKPGKAFFLLTVHMLYRSANLQKMGNNPGGEEYN